MYTWRVFDYEALDDSVSNVRLFTQPLDSIMFNKWE